ncbi:MAG TPA: hypothetical protein VK210_03330, partial [Terriglobia bacterium]|nr:hypothetical protein [Terriglobia bacterium]
MLTSLLKRSHIRAVVDVMALLIVAMLAFSAPVWAQDDDYSASSSASPDPVYPGIPPKGKVETTVGSQNLRFYGTILLNMSVSDSVEVGQDLVLWPLPGGSTAFPDGTTRLNSRIHDMIFTARQSVFGLQIKPTDTKAAGWHATGVLEFDLFGGRPFDGNQPQGRVFNEPRLRLGYFQFQNGDWRIVAGQDRMIVSPLDPVSLSHVAAPLGATAGNLWGWQPQLRVEHTYSIGNVSTVFQVGVVRPQFADTQLQANPASGSALDSLTSGLGERTTKPFYQAHYAATMPMMGSKATFGAGAHYGRERIGAQRDLDSWLFSFDFSVPLQSRVRVRGEGFVGSNLIPFQGGVLQGVAVFNPGGGAPIQFNKIGSGGGWGELIVKLTSDNNNVFYAGAGTDDP